MAEALRLPWAAIECITAGTRWLAHWGGGSSSHQVSWSAPHVRDVAPVGGHESQGRPRPPRPLYDHIDPRHL